MNMSDELLKLRALLAEKEAELEKKNNIIEKQRIQIENMTQALLHARKKMFGVSSEKVQMDGQMTLFSNMDDLADELSKDQSVISVKAHTKTPRKLGVRSEMLAGIPSEVEEYVIDNDETCPECGSKLKVIGHEKVRTEVEFIPAKLKVKHIIREVVKCTKCGTKDSPNNSSVIIKAKVPKPVLPHSLASSSVVAQVIYQKYKMGIPLNRQETDWFRMGLVLPRADMAHWVIRTSEEWIKPIYDKIRNQLIRCDVLHMDETRIQCNKEPGRKASSDSFMWVMRSGASEAIQATYFSYSPNRSTDVANKLVGDYDGYLITDAYAGYNKAGNYDRCLCWSHCKRYFIDSIPLDNKGKEISGSKGAEARNQINILFNIEKQIASLSFDEKKAKRQEVSKPVLDAFWSWVEETAKIPTTNAALTKALNYAVNQREGLETFLKDGRIPISNNLCESHIKPFATARRAWLFADTPKGAQASAVMYSIVMSATANNLNVYEYLKYLLDEMPNNDHLNNPEIIERYLPWSKELPEECYLQTKHKKTIQK